MKNMLRYTPSKDGRKVKRTTGVSIGFIGLLLTAGILFTILLLNSSVAAPGTAPDSSAVTTLDGQDLDANNAPDTQSVLTDKEKQRKAAERLKEKRDLPAKRKAAAERFKTAYGESQAAGTGTVATPGVGTLALPAGMDPGGIPHYFGPYPNYANSPIPTITYTGITPTTVGNPLIERGYATDNANNVFVIVDAVLPAGTLENLQIWNQAFSTGSPPSAGNSFHAYVLRPTGTANQYTVVFDSGLLTVPALTTPSVSEVVGFTMPSVPVQANDVIGFYGNGIPLDIGAGTDILSYPAPAAPIQGNTITLGVDPGFPIFPQARTYSIAATVNMGGAPVISGGIRKFVDSLPGLGSDGANNLGQYIPIAVPDTCTYSGEVADCYEIELREYTEKMHTDLPPTKLRGYVQVKNGADVAPIHYLGPMIIAKRDVPVRIKFTNKLPTGTGGDLFLPVDTTVMGAGPFTIDDPLNPGATISGNFTQNRAALHLHGGFTPWISDGTPHQWITPANENTPYPEGVSVSNVPDMPDPGNGSLTFYYTNLQSARLMFYHDHAFGITRLNVYAGEAAPYLLMDQVEQDLIDGTNVSGVNPELLKVLPDAGIPLVIQDKTFVDNTTIAAQDPTWNWGTGPRDANGKITEAITGDLWYPHVYMPNQNPWDASGMNAFGRWHYGPWFWPPTTSITYGPIPNPYNGTAPWEPPLMPATPNPSEAAEAFMDTPVVNGAVYPYLEVEPKAYRFRILNAADDRFFNLQLYVADPDVITADGRTNTEVKMVPASENMNYPENWPTDGREGGVPDPATAGPSFIQIGTEGGFLPKPVELPNLPVGWNLDATNFDMGLVNQGTLILGTAERADVIVNFSEFAGKTLILYNDAPAPFPAIDPRYDYYTGDPDLTDTGGAPSTLPGYGPNTRTLMQIRVSETVTDTSVSVDLPTLEAVFANNTAIGKRGVFEVSQDEIIMPQAEYNTAYDKIFPDNAFVSIFDTQKTFQTVSGASRTIPFEPKAIQDEMGETFDTEYGRMSAMLGLQLPPSPGGAQNFIVGPYLSPPVEIIKDSVYGTQIGSLDDGTQIWKITHNGVDTHTIHVHLFNAQLINRVAWDNARRVPDLNELGWKETFRVNPLQDTIIALRAVAPPLPFQVPNSIHPLDPTMPLGEPLKAPPGGFKDPNGNPITVNNELVNFGWEYVYHCHLLAHEEMDMMHSVILGVAPKAPSGLTATAGSPVTLTWTDNSADETNFNIQRATDSGFTTGLTTFKVAGSANGVFGETMTYIDTTVASSTTYYYRVQASNVVGVLNLGAYPTNTMDSEFSDPASVTTPAPTIAAPTNLLARITSTTQIRLTWTDASNDEASFAVWRSDNGGAYTQIGTVTRTPGQSTATGGSVAFSNNINTPGAPLVAGHTYTYYVTAVNAADSSDPSNTVTITFSAPAAPTGLVANRIHVSANQDRVTLTWTDNANNEANFIIQRSVNPTFNPRNTYTVVANVATFSQNVPRTNGYYYRVRARNVIDDSGWSNVVHVPPLP